MKPNDPTVTAIIPTYNRARFVGEAIESVLAQSRPVDEIVVIDDGSTDDTPERLKKYGNAIRYLWQQNRGPGAARNRGMKEARGDLLAFLDSDDLWVPRKTELQLDFLARNPGVECVFGDMANFSDRADGGAPEIKNPEVHDYLVAHATDLEELFDWLIIENVVPTPTVMFRRSAADRIGGFDETLPVAEDFDYWLRAAAMCRWGFVDAVLLKRRRHSANLVGDWTQRNLALVHVLATTANVLAQDRPTATPLIVKKLREIHYDLGSVFLKRRDFDRAHAHLKAGRPLGRREVKWRLKLAAAVILRFLKGRRPQTTEQ